MEFMSDGGTVIDPVGGMQVDGGSIIDPVGMSI